MPFSTAAQAATAAQWFGGTAATIPATYWVALLDVTGTELAGGGYARVALANIPGNFTISGSNPTSAANAVAVAFPQATGTWVQAMSFAYYADAMTGGTPLLQGLIVGQPVTILGGSTANFPAGVLVVQFN